jgi:hypothetical protein
MESCSGEQSLDQGEKLAVSVIGPPIVIEAGLFGPE